MLLLFLGVCYLWTNPCRRCMSIMSRSKSGRDHEATTVSRAKIRIKQCLGTPFLVAITLLKMKDNGCPLVTIPHFCWLLNHDPQLSGLIVWLLNPHVLPRIPPIWAWPIIMSHHFPYGCHGRPHWARACSKSQRQWGVPTSGGGCFLGVGRVSRPKRIQHLSLLRGKTMNLGQFWENHMAKETMSGIIGDG